MTQPLIETHRSGTLLSQFMSATMCGLAATLLLGEARFVASRPTSVLRFLFFAGYTYRSWWVGVLSSLVSLVVMRRARKSYLEFTVGCFLVVLASWLLIQLPPLNGWLLPEATTK